MSPNLYLGVGASIGVLVGALVTHTIIKRKYEHILDEEIRSVKEEYEKFFSTKETDISVTEVEKEEQTYTEEDRTEYKTVVTDYSQAFHEKSESGSVEIVDIHVEDWANNPDNEEEFEEDEGILLGIDILDFETFVTELDNFDRTLLVYNPNTGDIMTEDEEDIPPDMAKNMIGEEAHNRLVLGQVEDDTLYVMNGVRQTLYEVYVSDK